MSDELKPCPFCGGRAELYGSWQDSWIVECTKCHASTNDYKENFDAIFAWNTRADDAQVVTSAEKYKLADSREQLKADELQATNKPSSQFDVLKTAETAENATSKNEIHNFDDSREQLEADISAAYYTLSDRELDPVFRWLDRQAAITRREFDGECEFCQSEVARLQQRVDSLTDERNELQSIIDHMPKTEQECEACQEAHDRLMFNSGVDIGKLRDKVDRLTAERDQLTNAINELQKKQPYCYNPEQPLDMLNTIGRYIDELTTERDEAMEIRDQACGDAATFKAERDELKHTNSLLQSTIAELSLKVDEKQHVIDTQRESFRALEARASCKADPVEIQLALARFADEWTTTDTRAQEQRLITYYAQQIANLVDNLGGGE